MLLDDAEVAVPLGEHHTVHVADVEMFLVWIRAFEPGGQRDCYYARRHHVDPRISIGHFCLETFGPCAVEIPVLGDKRSDA